MDLKQEQIESLVVDYFRQRMDAEVRPISGGVYDVQLNSQIAQADFHGKHNLSLIFDGERAYENPESELVTSTHPYLDVIRNDLERNPEEDVRLAEGHITAQLISPEGLPVVPELIFFHQTGRLDFDINYHPTLVLTYRIDYETDERSENMVRLCYDATTGGPQHQLVPRLRSLYPRGGLPPVEVKDKTVDVAVIIEAARREIESRVSLDTQEISVQLQRQLEQEKKRLEDHYNSELELARDDVTRQQIVENRTKDIGEQERKLTCRVQVQLISALRLWWPIVNYRLTIPSRHGNFDVAGIRYDLKTEQTHFAKCKNCENGTRFNICVAAKHVVCGVCENSVSKCFSCDEDYCPHHGGPCGSCSKPSCLHDRQKCNYGSHSSDDLFCSDCLEKSFEGHPLCAECRDVCDFCERPFPHELIAECRLGKERVCQGHDSSADGLRCAECQQIVCPDHAVQTTDKTWACKDHVGVATCCRQTFGLSRLSRCTVDHSEELCPTHRVRCSDCREPVCDDHSSPLTDRPGEFVCDNCRHICKTCGPVKAYVSADLLGCQACEKEVCEFHRWVCVVGNEVVCDLHHQISVIKESLCLTHAGHCVQCGPALAHRGDSLRLCAVCKGKVCERDRFGCPTCKVKVLCHVHQPRQPTCAGCGRLSCGDSCTSNSNVCVTCSVAYCRHCSGTKNRCVTCTALSKASPNEYMLRLLQKAPAMVKGDVETLINSIVKARRDQLTFYSGYNQTYQMLEVQYKPRWFEVWKKSQRLHLVATIHGELTKVTVRSL